MPSRVTDSRKTIGLAPHVPAQTPKIATIDNRYPNDPSRNLPVDLINNNLQAVTGNVTFVTPTKSGFLTIRPPSDGAPPTTSTINSPAGDIRANGFVVGDNGSGVGVWYGAKYPGTTEVVIDATGYFTR